MPEVKTYTISVYRVQDRHRDCWTAEWEPNSRYSSDGPTAESALQKLLQFLAAHATPGDRLLPPLPKDEVSLQDQSINQELLKVAKNLLLLLEPDCSLEDMRYRVTHKNTMLDEARIAIAKAEGRSDVHA